MLPFTSTDGGPEKRRRWFKKARRRDLCCYRSIVTPFQNATWLAICFAAGFGAG
jgi:hypothetical protein